MNRELVTRWARRGAVLVTTAAVLVVGVSTVQVAADWRKASAPLDTAPVGMSTIEDDFTAETGRTDELSGQIDDVAAQISDLKVALIAANGSMATDQEQATVLQAQLESSAAKLSTLQRQLKAAQRRLTELNRAAAPQAELNRPRRARSAGSGTSTRPPADDDDGEEDDD